MTEADVMKMVQEELKRLNGSVDSMRQENNTNIIRLHERFDEMVKKDPVSRKECEAYRAACNRDCKAYRRDCVRDMEKKISKAEEDQDGKITEVKKESKGYSIGVVILCTVTASLLVFVAELGFFYAKNGGMK